jgi:hypothetical protein
MIALADPSKGQEILANYPNMWVPAGLLIIITVWDSVSSAMVCGRV